ncbi:MAG: Gfo/Idh/MocA family oxidoreductase [Phycisphaerae bacterium]
MKPHHVLVVGVGSIGERHTRCFLATGRARVAVCENNAELRRTVAQRYGCTDAYADLDAALAAERFDLVLIATPAHLHVPMASAVVRAGMNVLIEKPLSTSTDGVGELIRLAAGRGVQAAVAFTYRSHPLVRSMRSAVQSGRFGEPVQVVSVWGQHFPKYRPAYRSIYYTSRATGGGAIQDLLPHAINAVEYFVGPTERIMADADHKVLEGVEVEDTVHVIARHAGGVMACYSINQHQAPNENSITVICRRGTARFDLNGSRWLSMTEPGGEWNVEQTFSSERDDIYIAQANHYLDVLEGKAAPLCTVEEALHTLKVSLAILDFTDHPNWREIPA